MQFCAQVILRQMEVLSSGQYSAVHEATVKALCKKMAPPLVTLLSAESEIQYVALRNIHLIVTRHPSILAHEVKVS